MDDSASPHTKKNGFFKKMFKKGSEDVTEEEIISMVREGHEQGVLETSEAEMIHNIFEFGDKEAKDIMTHRKQMIMLDGEMSYTDSVRFIIESGRSRYPVYAEDTDTIIGVLHIKDAFAFCQRNEVFRTSVKDIPGLLREVEFVPETMKLDTLFHLMQKEKSHMVIVVDEYGQTSGLVAMEDILEEIVGNIEDEHDEENQQIEQESEGCYRIDGLTDFGEVVELLDLPVEKDAFDTLNGLLISLYEKIPADDERPVIHAYGYIFEVQEVEDKTIRDVLIRKEQ
jgi:putative hemolysin